MEIIMRSSKFRPIEKMTTVVRGAFGRFKTEKSYPINYMLSSLPIEHLKLLTTASELFSVDSIQFEELIQRDIDTSRVQTIANEYLAKSDQKVVFFPPLLVCMVVLDEQGKIKKQYESHEETIDEDNQVLKSLWDKNAFELSLILADPDDTDRVYNSKENGKTPYSDFGAEIRLNPKKVKLVVLDGQHRLSALRLIREGSNKHILNEIEVPICIIFSPSADKSISQQDMVNDFRELFVRVNLEQKKVSGHFIILLQDDSFSAMAVREYADHLKALDNTGFSALHLIEWNQRIDELTRKRTRTSSITTIGILFDILQNHFFSSGMAAELLQLPETIETNDNTDEDEIYLSETTDKIFGNETADNTVKSAIKNILVPSLDTLLRSPTPYQALECSVRDAFEKLQKRISENHSGFTSLQKDYLGKYIYRKEEINETITQNCLIEFQDWIDPSLNESPYLLHAFQQGMIRLWINLSVLLLKYGIQPNLTATALVAALEKLVLLPKKNYLGSTRLYTRRMIWKNEKVNFSHIWTREAWLQIIAISLLNKTARNALVKEIITTSPELSEKKDELNIEISQYAKQCLDEYVEKFNDELLKDTRASLPDTVSSEQLIFLQRKKLSKDPKERKEFDAKIRELSETKLDDALSELANVLMIEKSSISS